MTDAKESEIRKFGFIVGLALIGFGLFPLLERKQPAVYVLAPGILFMVIAIFRPSTLFPVYRVWMKIGHLLGRINSFIILSIVFYIFITPMSLAIKLFEKEKKFSFKIQKDSCWIKRNRENYKETMKRQF